MKIKIIRIQRTYKQIMRYRKIMKEIHKRILIKKDKARQLKL